MTENIEDFPIKASGYETPDRLLKAFNKDNKTTNVVIIGIDEDGDVSVSSSYPSLIEAVGLIEYAKHGIMNSE